jgi:hypothetical protein
VLFDDLDVLLVDRVVERDARRFDPVGAAVGDQRPLGSGEDVVEDADSGVSVPLCGDPSPRAPREEPPPGG